MWTSLEVGHYSAYHGCSQSLARSSQLCVILALVSVEGHFSGTLRMRNEIILVLGMKFGAYIQGIASSPLAFLGHHSSPAFG